MKNLLFLLLTLFIVNGVNAFGESDNSPPPEKSQLYLVQTNNVAEAIVSQSTEVAIHWQVTYCYECYMCYSRDIEIQEIKTDYPPSHVYIKQERVTENLKLNKPLAEQRQQTAQRRT